MQDNEIGRFKTMSRTEQYVIIVLLGIIIALVSYMIFLSITHKKTYIAGKYGKICYYEKYKAIQRPVFFGNLGDCLKFVGD